MSLWESFSFKPLWKAFRDRPSYQKHVTRGVPLKAMSHAQSSLLSDLCHMN